MTTSIRYLRTWLHLPDRTRRPIGYLSQYGDILRVSFDDAYVGDPGRPALSLTFRGADETATRAILTATYDGRLVQTGGYWPAYFENLLPEGRNRDRLAAARGCGPDDEFELLAAAGHDLMGAVEVEPVAPDTGIPDDVRAWHTALGFDVLEPGFVEAPVEDAAALPGVVTKFSAIQEGRRYVVRRQGAAGAFILKLPTTRHPDLVANEFTGYRLCGSLGLRCARATVIARDEADLPEVAAFDDILAVARFDRGPEGLRIHMEEFAQVLGYRPRHKYGKDLTADYGRMLRLLNELSSQPVTDVREFVRRFVAFILMGNIDAHLKNWALEYPDGRTPRLAPLYDPVCVTALFDAVGPGDYAVNRDIDRKLRTWSWHDLSALLGRAGVLRGERTLRLARETVRQARAEWPALLKDAPPSVARAVNERLDGGVALTR